MSALELFAKSHKFNPVTCSEGSHPSFLEKQGGGGYWRLLEAIKDCQKCHQASCLGGVVGLSLSLLCEMFFNCVFVGYTPNYSLLVITANFT